MRGTGTATDERQRINLIVIPGLTGDLLIYKAALVLHVFSTKATKDDYL